MPKRRFLLAPLLLGPRAALGRRVLELEPVKNEIARRRTAAETARLLCREEDEVRENMKEIGLVVRAIR